MINTVISNQRISPYRLQSEDTIDIKIDLYNNSKKFYTEALTELYINYPSGWIKVNETYTNKNGNNIIQHSCSGINDISNCLGYVKVLINNNIYYSNKIRFNFIPKQIYDGFIIFPNNLIEFENQLFVF